MADKITLVSSPAAVILIGEGANFCLQKYSADPGSKSRSILTFPETQAAYLNKYFEIEIPSGKLKFYFKTTPDFDDFEIRTWDIADTFAQFVVKLIEDLSKFYELIKFYTINNPTLNYIKFTAREIGTAHLITFVGSDVTGLIKYADDLGEDDDIPDDFKIYAAPLLHTIYYDNTGLPLGEDLLSIDSDRKAYPDFAEYLKSQLSSSFNYPFNGEIVHDVTDAVVKFYIRYAEYYDSEIKQLYNTYASPKYAVLGGLKRIDSDFLLDEGGDYFSYNDNDMRFLTWAPLSKTTFPGSPERLYFLKTQSANIVLKLQATTTVKLPAETVKTITSDAYTIIEIAAGVPELFAGEDVSDFIEYDVWLEDLAGTKISEVRNYVVDQQDYRNVRVMFFKNSFGMYETLSCTGILSVSDNIESEEIEVLTGPVFRRKKNLSENNPLYALSSGWLEGKETRLWLEDLLISKDVFLCLGDFLLPVITKNGKVARQSDLEFFYSLNLEFEPDYKEQRYSAIVGEGATFLVDEDWVIYTDENGIKLIE